MHAVYACVYAASVHFWLSGTVCVGAQVQLLLSPVAVISELRGIISSLQLRSLFHPNYIPVIKMLIRTVKGAIKRVIKKALFHQSTCLNALSAAGSLLIFTLFIMPEA